MDGRRWRCHRNVVACTATVQNIIKKTNPSIKTTLKSKHTRKNNMQKNVVDSRRWRSHRNVVVCTATVQTIIQNKKRSSVKTKTNPSIKTTLKSKQTRENNMQKNELVQEHGDHA